MISDPSGVNEDVGAEPIAVIGLACRVPGASNAEEFWRNLVDGVDSLSEYTLEEQAAEGVPQSWLDDPDYVPAAMVLDDMEYFDAAAFGMTAREAELRDPQHRLFLELAHTALEDAAYDPSRYPGEIGVYGAVGGDEYQWRNIRRNPKIMATTGDIGLLTSNHPDYLATLAAYKLNLRGPALTVHTACSSSLVALHLAVEALRNGECEMALAGGASVELPHRWGYVFHEGSIVSPDGHCRAFDADAQGTVWGSGGGVVLLKRLSDAIADGDHIRAVVRGNAINNDGAEKIGFSAPSIEGQVAVIASALGVADVDPRTVTYVEAHGTGTALGDPIEVAALSSVFGRDTDDRQWCALASVKTNIGHLGPAAGAAGFIKTVLALEHGLIPPIVHFERPHAKIDFDASPFYVNASLSVWDGADGPRRAGVSSFGIGGTNAHLVLEEAPVVAQGGRKARSAHLVQVSARTATALTSAVDNLAAHLGADGGADLGDVAHTLRKGRRSLDHRAAVVATDAADAAAGLRAPKRVMKAVAGPKKPRVAFLFSGQGSQFAGMGAELYREEPVFAEAVDECVELLRDELGGVDLRELMFASGDADADARLERTELTQPALFVLEYALVQLWKSWGVEPDAMIGHSIGEYVAAAVSGVFGLADVLHLVAVRGKLMQSMPPGSMVAVTVDESDVRPMLPPEMSVATVNGQRSCVVAGPTEVVERFLETLTGKGVGAKPLRTSHAFHSPMMEPILSPFREQVAAVPRFAPAIPFLSDVTGDWITPEAATDPSYWATHLREAVRFSDCVQTLLADGEWILLEIGPGKQLSGLARRYFAREAVPPMPSLPGPKDRDTDLATMYAAAAQLWLSGIPVDVEGTEEDQDGAGGSGYRRVPLPTYPYERKRYWIEPTTPDGTDAEPERTGPLPLDEWFAVPTWSQVVAEETETPKRCLFFGDGPLAARVAAGLRAAGVDVLTVGARDGSAAEAAGPLVRPAERGDFDALVAEFGDALPSRIVHAFALDGAEAGGDAALTWKAQDRGFFSLLALAQALAAAAPAEGVRLDVLTAGTQDVVGGDLVRPEHATVAGPARVLSLELPWLAVRHIDVDGRRPDAAAECVSELLTVGPDGSADAVALRGGRRWVQSWAPVKAPAPAGPSIGLRAGAVCVVTGGLGGIGITVAEDLAAEVGAKIVLVARSPLPDRTEWDTHLAVHGVRERVGRAITTIRRIEQSGGEVLVCAADVTSAEDMARVREEAVARFGRVDVLVHAAGVPGGGMAEVKERAQAEAVLAPKILGTLALRSAFGDLPLDAVVLCSSVTAVAGGFGQVDYCAANSFMDALAHGDHGFQGRVVSLNWGGWLEVGMAAEVAAPDAFRALQRGVVSSAIDHPVLSTAHRDPSGGPASCVGIVAPQTHWVLDEHRIHGTAVMPGTGHLENVRAAAEAAFGDRGDRRDRGDAGDRGDRGDGLRVELRDVVFVEPMSVENGGHAEVCVAFDESADGHDFQVSSQSAGMAGVHVRGSVGWVAPGPAPVHDLAAIRSRCTVATVEKADQSSHSGMLAFGPRWSSLRRVEVGVDEELGYFEAGDTVAAELGRWGLHPALLDEATAFGTSRGGGAYLPMGYGTLLMRADHLPPRMWSHLRYRGDAGNAELIAADLTLMDEHGTEVAVITDFILRRVDSDAINADLAAKSAPVAETRPATSAVGIAPSAGAEALRRMLATDRGPQVSVTAGDIRRIITDVRKFTQETVEEALGDAAERPSRDGGDYTAPRTDVEKALCVVWENVLGSGQVGVDDDFFDLGGNSLVAVQLIAQTRMAFGIKLPMRTLFESPTVAGMATLIERLRAEAPPKEADAAPITRLERT